MNPLSFQEAAALLRGIGVPVTIPRMEIARTLFSAPVHLSADQVLANVRERAPDTSRATVYNTLKLFRDKNLLRELIIDRERVVYDSNTAPHHHVYDATTGELTDIPTDELRIVGMPSLPVHVELECVDVIVRVRAAR